MVFTPNKINNTTQHKTKTKRHDTTRDDNRIQHSTAPKADSRSRTPKDLRPPRVREQTDDAGEQAGEEHDHADADAGALVGDGGQADDGAEEEDGAEEDGDEGAGALDAAVGEVEELALWEVGVLGRVLLVGVVSGA